MSGTDIVRHPVHLGRGASAVIEPAFTGNMEWYEGYISRHADEARRGGSSACSLSRNPGRTWCLRLELRQASCCTSAADARGGEFEAPSLLAHSLERQAAACTKTLESRPHDFDRSHHLRRLHACARALLFVALRQRRQRRDPSRCRDVAAPDRFVTCEEVDAQAADGTCRRDSDSDTAGDREGRGVPLPPSPPWAAAAGGRPLLPWLVSATDLAELIEPTAAEGGFFGSRSTPATMPPHCLTKYVTGWGRCLT